MSAPTYVVKWVPLAGADLPYLSKASGWTALLSDAKRYPSISAARCDIHEDWTGLVAIREVKKRPKVPVTEWTLDPRASDSSMRRMWVGGRDGGDWATMVEPVTEGWRWWVASPDPDGHAVHEGRAITKEAAMKAADVALAVWWRENGRKR